MEITRNTVEVCMEVLVNKYRAEKNELFSQALEKALDVIQADNHKIDGEILKKSIYERQLAVRAMNDVGDITDQECADRVLEQNALIAKIDIMMEG